MRGINTSKLQCHEYKRDKGQADVAKYCSDYDFRKVGSKDKNSRTYAALAGYI